MNLTHKYTYTQMKCQRSECHEGLKSTERRRRKEKTKFYPVSLGATRSKSKWRTHFLGCIRDMLQVTIWSTEPKVLLWKQIPVVKGHTERRVERERESMCVVVAYMCVHSMSSVCVCDSFLPLSRARRESFFPFAFAFLCLYDTQTKSE